MRDRRAQNLPTIVERHITRQPAIEEDMILRGPITLMKNIKVSIRDKHILDLKQIVEMSKTQQREW